MDLSPYVLFRNGIRELVSLGVRLGEKIKDKYIWSKDELEDAKAYIRYFRDSIESQEGKEDMSARIFGQHGDFFEVEPLARGYNTKVVSFKTMVGGGVRKWVMKIGHRISPVVDFGDPSAIEYAVKFKNNLDILQKCISIYPELSSLLPIPQEVLWAQLIDGKKRHGTTLILQPFVEIVKPRQIKKTITKEERLDLLYEFKAFKLLCDELIATHHLRPDLLGEGNLEVAKTDTGYHLVLLDTGMLNMLAPIPFTQAVMHFASMQTLGRLEYLLKYTGEPNMLTFFADFWEDLSNLKN